MFLFLPAAEPATLGDLVITALLGMGLSVFALLSLFFFGFILAAGLTILCNTMIWLSNKFNPGG